MKWQYSLMRAALFVVGVFAHSISLGASTAPQLLEHATKMEAKHSIPVGLLHAVIEQESGWRNVAGRHGEIGLGQIKPSTVILVAGENPYSQKTVVFTEGSKGDTIKQIQAALSKETAPDLVVDGIFGPLTRGAVELFQRNAGLNVDGIVGVRTWGRLLQGLPYPGKTIATALWDPEENLEWTARVMVYYYEQCGRGSWALAVAAYNGGCGNPVVVHANRVMEKWKRNTTTPIVRSIF